MQTEKLLSPPSPLSRGRVEPKILFPSPVGAANVYTQGLPVYVL